MVSAAISISSGSPATPLRARRFKSRSAAASACCGSPIRAPGSPNAESSSKTESWGNVNPKRIAATNSRTVSTGTPGNDGCPSLKSRSNAAREREPSFFRSRGSHPEGRERAIALQSRRNSLRVASRTIGHRYVAPLNHRSRMMALVRRSPLALARHHPLRPSVRVPLGPASARGATNP